MLLFFILLALVVGAISGVAIGYETRDLRNQPTGWRPWLLFAGVAAVVATAAALVGYINEIDPPTGTTKTLALLAGAVAFTLALRRARRPR